MPENDTLPIDPAYVLDEEPISGVLIQSAQSGRRLERLMAPDRRVFRARFLLRSTEDKKTLYDFWNRFRNSYFVLNHKVHNQGGDTPVARKFPVEFLSAPRFELATNEGYNVEFDLVEGVGRALLTPDYPDPADGLITVFDEEDDPEARVVAGTWTPGAHADAHAGNEKTNPNTNTTDAFQWTYSGYGFRVWARKAPDLGIVEVLLDEVSLGNVDLYDAAAQPSAALLTKLDVTLGLHRIKLKATNTKNASSTANTIVADAIEVMM